VYESIPISPWSWVGSHKECRRHIITTGANFAGIEFVDQLNPETLTDQHLPHAKTSGRLLVTHVWGCVVTDDKKRILAILSMDVFGKPCVCFLLQLEGGPSRLAMKGLAEEGSK